jgi:hypothetical protein
MTIGGFFVWIHVFVIFNIKYIYNRILIMMNNNSLRNSEYLSLDDLYLCI